MNEQTMVDGGFVNEVLRHPRGEGRIAVRAEWTGIIVSEESRSKNILHHIKNDIFVGTWRVVGIESHAKMPREAVVVVEPDEVLESISPGDVLILGRGAVSKYIMTQVHPKPETALAVELGPDRIRGILAPSKMLGIELLVFHGVADDVSSLDLESIASRSLIFSGELTYVVTSIARYTLEFRLLGKAVAARSIIDILTPVRSFILDASEEMCLDIPRKKGRRAEEESELFEPVITAKAASVRFRVHPSSSRRTQGLETSKPFDLLCQVLQLANSGDRDGVRRALENGVKSVDDSLRQVEAIVKAARRQKLEFSATNALTPIALGNRALSTIKSVEINVRHIKKIQGDIYAVDLRRSWCRISTSNTEPPEDWRLEFSDDLLDSVRGEYPRRVEVEFETQARPGMTTGKGLLLNIQDLARHSPGFS